MDTPDGATTPHPPTASSPPDRDRLYRRSLRVVLFCQVLGGAGLAAGVTVGALLVRDLFGGEELAGLPSALFTLGSASAAFAVGRIAQRAGRRPGLAAGFLVGSAGAIGIVIASVLEQPVLLFASMVLYGSGGATNLQARYAGADLAPPDRRGTAVSIAMVSTTLGAVAGPNSVDLLGRIAVDLGLPALTGPFLLAAVAYGLAGLALLAFLRPDPLVVARQLMRADAAAAEAAAAAGVAAAVPEGVEVVVAAPDAPTEAPRGIALGAATMVLSQVSMVVIMTMTPVHMQHHDHGLGAIGFVIGMHIGSMFLPSLITGPLVDRVGRVPMAIASAVTLLAAGITAALAPGDSLPVLTVALVLLGIGWNFGLISGTSIIVDSTTPERRASVQGSVDVLIAISGSAGGVASGLVMGASSYATLGLAGGLFSLLLVPVVAWHRAGAAGRVARVAAR